MNLIYFYRFFSRFRFRERYIFSSVYKMIVFILFNSVVPLSCIIGERTRFMYGGIGCVIHKKAKIGRNVAIGQGITIGRKKEDGAPVIGDDVYISAGSRVLGNISVGNNVIIGANSVVLSDVPDNSIVVGSPAKVVKSVSGSIWDELGDII